MVQAHTLKDYTRLLSLHLFRVMEEGETLLLEASSSRIEPTSSFHKQMHQARNWLGTLVLLDPGLVAGTLPLLAPKADKSKKPSTLEDLVNATAQTLMMLDDRYRVFAPANKTAATVMIPLMQIHEIGPDTDFPGSRPVS